MPAAKLVEELKKDFGKKLKSAINTVRYEVKGHTNNEINKIKNEIKSLTNNEIAKAKIDIKSHTNDEIAKAKSNVKSHTKGEISKVKSQTNDYINKVKSQTNDYISKVKNHTNDEISKVKNHTNDEISKVKNHTKKEDKKLEGRLHNLGGITLHGSKSGADRGIVYFQGSPLCDDDSKGRSIWSHKDARVICKMLGFSNARKWHRDNCHYGDCPPGICFPITFLIILFMAIAYQMGFRLQRVASSATATRLTSRTVHMIPLSPDIVEKMVSPLASMISLELNVHNFDF